MKNTKMAQHNEIGKRGEIMAACWLSERGFQIMFRNWRNQRGEIDIIARKKGVLHFIEVKTRRTNSFGHPEERIDKRKWRSMINSSMAFLEGFGEEAPFQFDIISILIESNTAKYFFIDDAFP
jgi:putative endonuclease